MKIGLLVGICLLIVEPLLFSQLAVVAVFSMLLYIFTNKLLECYEN
jgi:hypothetical protein